jgi:hypothetical protein
MEFLSMSYFVRAPRGSRFSRDPDSPEFPDKSSAREEAVASAREMLAEAIRTSAEDIPDRLIIADHEGHEVGSVRLSELLPRILKDR